MERFLYDRACVSRPFEEVAQILEEHPEDVVLPAAEAATHHADEIVARLGFAVGGFRLERDVRVELEGFDAYEHLAVLSFRWEAVAARSFFPTMLADIEVVPLPSGHHPVSQVSFVGQYRPPLWLFGAAADAVAGRRVAEAVVRRFLDEVAARIEGAPPAATAGAVPAALREGRAS